MSQHLGQSAFVASLGSLGSLSEIELSQMVFINSAWLAMVALWSRAWLSNWAARISFTSFAREDLTVWDVIVAGGDGSCGMMESFGTPSGVVAYKDDNDKDGLEAAAAVLAGDMGLAEAGMVILDMGTGGGSTDTTLRIESVLEAL